MFKKVFVSLSLSLLVLLAFSNFLNSPSKWSPEDTVYDVLIDLGEPKPDHWVSTSDAATIKRGEQLVKLGKAKSPAGKQGKFISVYYNCTSCHNIQQEDPDLAVSDPEARLDYAQKQQIPFLQATTFKGIVNRESWYNDDYIKKYGSLVEKARNSLKESIELCAVECSQGRSLAPWEMEAIIAYLWTLQYTLDDILTAQKFDSLQQMITQNTDKAEIIAFLKKQYAQKSPAHFTDAPKNKAEGYPISDKAISVDNGKAIYALSCQHCHKPNGVSDYVLDDSKLTFRKLLKDMTLHNEHSFYQAIRYGTSPKKGSRPYMPHYPVERMSNKQVEELRAYIEKQVE